MPFLLAVEKRHCRVLLALIRFLLAAQETALPCPPGAGHGSAVSLQMLRI